MDTDEIKIPVEAKIKYLERRKKDVELCQLAITNQDYKYLEKIGHDLKGNAITFGFAPLSPLGESLETSAHNKDVESLKSIVKSYSDYLKTASATQ